MIKLFTVNLGSNKLTAHYHRELEAIVYDVDDKDGVMRHTGDGSCNLNEIIREFLDDYTALDRARLELTIAEKVIDSLEHEDAPDQAYLQKEAIKINGWGGA